MLTLSGAAEHNLKNITVHIPVGSFTVVTGVSGSGKSTLIDETLKPALMNHFYGSKEKPGKHRAITGMEHFDKVIEIDQSPIGRTPRSNPATYVGFYSEIRELFAMTEAAKARGYTAGRFSFNVKGGRCEVCGGDGVQKLEMSFLPDVYVTCEACDGLRYNKETLEARFKGKNIGEVLNMTIPGVPCIYQGDEYAEIGAGDPDNRHMMRFDGLNENEQTFRNKIRSIISLRRNSMALMYGDYLPIYADDDTLEFERVYMGEHVRVKMVRDQQSEVEVWYE